MKVTTEKDIDLEDFEAWSGGKDWLETLIKCGTVKKAQSEIEELYPDGIDEGALNDYLWFDIYENHPEWWSDDFDEMQEIKERVDGLDKPWFESSCGQPIRLAYEDDEDDLRVFKLQAEALGGNAGSYVCAEIDYDFSKTWEDNVEDLLHECYANDVYPSLPEGEDYVEDFPCWAITYLMYGDASGITDEDQKMVDEWAEENGCGEIVSALESTHNEFNKWPAFGKACDTETVVVITKKEENK